MAVETNGEIVILDMTEDDMSEMVALGIKAAGLEDGPYSGVIDSYVGGELGLSCVAEVRGKMVGFVLGRLAYTPPPVTKSAWIQLMVVDLEHRREGIGRRLLDRFRQRCQDRGVKMVHISVPSRDTAIHAFLEGCGFHKALWIHFSSAVEE